MLLDFPLPLDTHSDIALDFFESHLSLKSQIFDVGSDLQQGLARPAWRPGVSESGLLK